MTSNDDPSKSGSNGRDRSTDGTSPVPSTRRRKFLYATGGVAAAALLAGCQTTQKKRYAANPLSLKPAAGKLGYSLDDSRTLKWDRTETVAGSSLQLTIVNHLAAYDDGDLSFDVVATPQVKAAGQELNPVAKVSLSDIVGGTVGRKYLSGSLGGRTWKRGPKLVDKRHAKLLGGRTTLRTYAGITSQNELGLVALTRGNNGDLEGEKNGEIAIVGGATSWTLDSSTSGAAAMDGVTNDERFSAFVSKVHDTFPYVVQRPAAKLSGTATPEPTAAPETTETTVSGSSAFADVPLDLVRSAADHVHSYAGSDAAPGWDNPRLNGEVRPMYRPDVEGVAYYEFGVDPEGFVLVSTDAHDYPIPHWNSRRPPLSQQLAETADGELDRLYKLDALYYVGESPNGERLAEWGDRILKVGGVTKAQVLDKERPISTRQFAPVDPEAEPGNLEFEKTAESGPQTSDATVEAWESWSATKEGYASVYAPFIADLRQGAAEEWTSLRDLEQKGIGVLKGEERTIPLLFDHAKYDVTGAGAELVSVERTDGEPPALHLVVNAAASEKQGAPLSIELSYANGRNETLRYVVAPASVEASVGAALADADAPAAAGYGGAARDVTGVVENAMTGVGAANSRSGKRYYTYAGSARDQRAYRQWRNNGHAVGCGPVAWAMMYGWADYRAANGTGKWSRQRGLFRKDGGTYPKADITAPKKVHWNNAAFNVIEELHKTVKTHHFGHAGYTTPWHMARAWRFYRGRAPGWTYCWWSPVFARRPWLRRKARDMITKHATPAIIGIGFAHHYPLAWGYSHKSERKGVWPFKHTVHHRSFYLNAGHGDTTAGWINARTWFAGFAYPHKTSV